VLLQTDAEATQAMREVLHERLLPIVSGLHRHGKLSGRRLPLTLLACTHLLRIGIVQLGGQRMCAVLHKCLLPIVSGLRQHGKLSGRRLPCTFLASVHLDVVGQVQ
jgi:hypothetical protein